MLVRSEPPFHLTRRGWGEFPVRIQIHFKDTRNKRIDIIHQLKVRPHHGRLACFPLQTETQYFSTCSLNWACLYLWWLLYIYCRFCTDNRLWCLNLCGHITINLNYIGLGVICTLWEVKLCHSEQLHYCTRTVYNSTLKPNETIWFIHYFNIIMSKHLIQLSSSPPELHKGLYLFSSCSWTERTLGCRHSGQKL